MATATVPAPAVLPPAVPGLPGRPAGLFGRAYRGSTIGSVALVSLMAFEALAVTTAMPTVAAALDGLSLYALAFGVPFATGVVGMVAAGIWSDARCPARPMRHGVGWFVAGLAVAGTAPTMELVVAGRVVQGFGSGLLGVALYVIVAKVYPERLRPRIFAAFAGAWVVPAIVGPAIAGLVVQYAGWRWVFLAVPVLALPAAVLLRPALRTVPAQRRPAGSGLVGRGPVGRTLALGSVARIGWAFGAGASAALLHYGGHLHGPTVLAVLGVALVGLAISAPKLLPAGVLRARPGLPAVVALRGLAAAAFVGAEVFVPLLLSRERGLSPAAAGFALTVGALSWSVGSWLQGRSGDPQPSGAPSRGRLSWVPASRVPLSRVPLSRRTLLRLGMTLIVAGIGFVALTVSPSVPTLVGIAGWSAAGLGMGMVYPTLSVLTLALSAPAEQGRNTSALQIGDSLSAAIVLALGGVIFAATPDPGPLTYLGEFGVAAGLALAGVLVAGRAAPRTAAMRLAAPAPAAPAPAAPASAVLRVSLPRTDPRS